MSIGRKGEETVHAFADTAVSEERPVNFEQRPVVSPMSDEILVCDAITDILFRIEEAMIKLVLEFLTV